MPLVRRRRRLQTRYSNSHRTFPPPVHLRRRSSTFSSRHQSYSPFSKSLRMADEFGLNDNSSTQLNYGSSDSSFGIKIKTLDLQTYSVRVNRNMSILDLKEEILSKIGVAIEDQRLLYKGTGAESSQNTSRIPLVCSTNEACILLDEQLSSVPFARMPSLQAVHEIVVTPNALTTISGFIDRMERMLPSSSNSFNTSQHQTIWMNTTTESLNRGGMPTPENLSFILDRTGQFLRDNTATAISHLSSLLQTRDRPYDPVMRGQIRFGAINLAVAMQHLGAMLLELGRVTMRLSSNHALEESVIDAGHAVYISRTGPNPVMVQPFPSSSWRYNPVIFRVDPSDPRSLASQFPASSTSTGAPSTASIPNVLSSNTQLQSSSNAVQPDFTQDFHAAMDVNEFFRPDDLLLDIYNDGISDDSENVVGAEDAKQSSSEENRDSDLAVSGKVEQQVDLSPAVEIIEQNGDPINIFGALLESSVRLHGEQDVYQDILELGNNEELANEFTEVLKRDVLRRLAKESFV